MSESSRPSAFEIDSALLGIVDRDSLSQEATERLDEVIAADRAFLEAYPDPRSAGIPESPASSPRSWRWRPIGLAIAASVGIAIYAAGRFETFPDSEVVRAKGASTAALLVRRGNTSSSFTGQLLRGGDILAIRYSSERHYLTLVSVQAGGRVDVIDAVAISPGAEKLAPVGIRLDDGQEPERLYALFADEVIALEVVRDAVGDAAPAALGRLALPAEQAHWLIRRRE